MHHAVFSNRLANTLYGAWLSIFYACPIAFWVPTHLLNHHRHENRAADVARTDRRSSAHGAWQALAYTVSCAGWQLPLIANYVRQVRRRGGQRWHELRVQSSCLVLGHLGLLTLAVGLHGARLGAITYVLATGGPALLATSFMFFTNYMQHVHCDSSSADNHSRNFVSPIANWFLFDAGYHTVHHEYPDVHWSRYASLHAARAADLDPSLNVPSMLGFCVENYLLGSFSSRFGTTPLGPTAAGCRAPRQRLSSRHGSRTASPSDLPAQ
jgi:fatty acid desaturase